MTNLAIRDELLTGLSDEIREQLRTYRDLLLHWNQRFNLTAVNDAEAVDRRLVGDALRLLPAVDRAIQAAGPRARLVDLGTGAGLPGLIIKIARPEMAVTLVDATSKKVRFVQHVIAELGLTGARAVHGRAEDLGVMLDFRQQFDVATARGVAALPTLLEFVVPLLVPGGTFILPKGNNIDDELVAGQRACAELGGKITAAELLPGNETEPVTRLVIGVKIRSTPDRYPRRVGTPSREPLGRQGT